MKIYNFKNLTYLFISILITITHLNIHTYGYLDIYNLSFDLPETPLDSYELGKLADSLKRNPTLTEADAYARKLGKTPFSDKTIQSFIQKYTNEIAAVSIIAAYCGIIYGLLHTYSKKIDSLMKSSFKIYQPYQIKDNFNSVAGNHEAKEAFQDIVEYLKNPDLYSKIGAKPTKGILLTGAPGTGKTLLARALAGEANCSFIYASGSEFQTVWVGSGTQNIKNIFNIARNLSGYFNKKTPCIIFIDEIDTLAKRRGMGNSLEDQTVNQLLIELDGFIQEEHPVIVIAATNFPEKIDPALLRPGRIDRIIHIDAPCLQDRKDILNLHLKKVIHDKNINISSIAQRTVGFTGAQLAEIVNAAARLAVNRNAKEVEQIDLENALDNQTIGIQSKIPLSDQERTIVAYHESGHALVSLLLNKKEIPTKITILPRGNALGITHFTKTDELKRIKSKDEFLDEICVCFGGKAAEEIIFNLISTGPSNDLIRANIIAKSMIQYYGMGTSLLVETYESKLSERIVFEEIKNLLHNQYMRTKELLTKHINKLHTLAKALLEKETLYYQDILSLNLI